MRIPSRISYVKYNNARVHCPPFYHHNEKWMHSHSLFADKNLCYLLLKHHLLFISEKWTIVPSLQSYCSNNPIIYLFDAY